MSTTYREPAFPTAEQNYEIKYATEGMTLRDYFAAKALPWFADAASADAAKGLTWLQVAARGAYELADAMIEARSQS